MAEFDIIAKKLIRTYPTDFARFALQRDDVERAEVLDTEQPSVRRADSLLSVHVGGEKVLVHHEIQTTDSTDQPMPKRMANYIAWLTDYYDLPVYSTVIYLRPDAGRRDPGYYIQKKGRLLMVVEYDVVRLREVEGQRILDAGHLSVLPFTPLMQPPADVDADGWLRQCVNRVQALPMDAPRKTDYLADLAIFSELAYTLGTIETIIPEEIMKASSVVQHFTEKALKEGIEQGIEQGLEQGLERGSRERAVEYLLDVLELRFGLVASAPLAARIGAIKDVQRLKHLHRAAVQVPSLEAFSSRLDAE